MVAKKSRGLRLYVTNMLSLFMDRFVDRLFSRLRGLGYQARMISVGHLCLLQKQINEQRDQGLLDNQFYLDRLDWFQFKIPESLTRARSLIIVAVPIPQNRAIFTWNGKRRPPLLLQLTLHALTNAQINESRAFLQKY